MPGPGRRAAAGRPAHRHLKSSGPALLSPRPRAAALPRLGAGAVRLRACRLHVAATRRGSRRRRPPVRRNPVWRRRFRRPPGVILPTARIHRGGASSRKRRRVRDRLRQAGFGVRPGASGPNGPTGAAGFPVPPRAPLRCCVGRARAAVSPRKRPRSSNRDLSSALRWYENTRRRKVKAMSWVTTLQVSRSESVLRPAAMIPDRLMTWALTTFLRSVSHRRLSAEVSRDLEAATTTHLVHANQSRWSI